MKQFLYNKLSAKEREALLDRDPKKRFTLSFYKYYDIGNPDFFRNYLFFHWDKINVLGRIYIAKEGINAQLSVEVDQFKAFKNHLDSISFLEGVRLNIAILSSRKSFFKLKVKVRPKIVADGLNDKTFDLKNSGVHVDADDFNKLISQEDALLVDMRNHYESEIGHFENAITPDVDTFRESLPIIEKQLLPYKQDRKLVMYCTGGIRCEKASAWFKHRGFKEVYQLNGGIIEYARQIKEKGLENKFKGKNFVFDQRLSEPVSDEIISNCHQCGKPADSHTNCANKACHLLFIQCSCCANKMQGCCSTRCNEILKLPEEKQREIRKNKKIAKRIFKKARSSVLIYKK